MAAAPLLRDESGAWGTATPFSRIMITDALRYPQRDDDWVRLTIIGGLLTLFGFLLVPLFVVAGYVLRVLRVTMDDEGATAEARPGETGPGGTGTGGTGVPGFEDWPALAVDGLKGLVIAAVYFLVPTIVGGVAVGFGMLAAVGDSGAVSVLGALFALGGFLFTLALTLAALYVLPAALATYVATDRLGSAFSPAVLRPALANRRYATGWVYAFVTVVAANVVINVLVFFAGIGLVLAPFASFYASVMAAYIVGRTWSEMNSIEVREDGSTDERAAV